MLSIKSGEVQSNDKTYYVSAGEADWVYSFLSRFTTESEFNNRHSINTLKILYLSPDGYNNLKTMLSNSFYNRLSANLSGIKELLKRNNINFIAKETDILPDYHGHMFGDWVIYGKWLSVGGLQSVRTTMLAINKIDNYFEKFKKMFD